jgi:glycosyltransferase involved in cell wall biosynthesis
VRRWVERLERRQLRSADAVVAITDAMLTQYRMWDVQRGDVHVIPNWAPLDEIRPTARDNDWAKRHDLPQQPIRLLYAGTLGRKHNPLLLLELLDACRARGLAAHLVVVSEGVGADDLRAASSGRSDVTLLGYQPAEQLSEMVGSADAVVALLEPDAAQFSVPSKVLTYLAAGRPIIALIPPSNPAAIDVDSIGGFVGEPTSAGAREAAVWLHTVTADPAGLRRIGANARQLAVSRFDVARIADQFEVILARAANARSGLTIVAS